MPKSKKTEIEKVEPIVVQKKRGRKPKGGKVITITEKKETIENISNNVIVHLKCKKSDLVKINEPVGNIISSYSENESNYQSVVHKRISNKKTIHDKLKQLQHNLHNNIVNETNSACFWCTYNFTNLPISIPKFEINKTYHVYGCFCSPECACAYLMNENIDSSIKFERYHLLSLIYGKVYGYNTNIKPAPNPHYTLNKFFGNLSIEEYRGLFESERHLFIIDKPITRELPEIHEEYKNENNFIHDKHKIIMNTFNTA